MSILIKGMEMPRNCHSCPMCLMRFCQAGDMELSEQEARPNAKRPDDCPLVEIPPHGRLIDADELRWFYDNSDVADDVITKENYDQLKVAVAVVRQTIDDAPTIIPAEENSNG